ncbi:hypothetical protein LG003_21030 [Photorhabdus kleinii]|uniref:hypothetical protein n=1 Tax=Photorhabdus kleinii TaxID=768034 RepID=UPI0021D492C2|nr:hypothetical protein [Photorhabdus kleinii]MCT8345258.1 hypothetical protein [Photorhabdus kleinii]
MPCHHAVFCPAELSLERVVAMANPRQLDVLIIMVAAKLNTMTVIQFAPDGGEAGNRFAIDIHHHIVTIQVQPATARDIDHLVLFVVMKTLFVTDIIADVAQTAEAVIIN